MAKLRLAKQLELEAFWRSHLDGWRRSLLNQREYCEAHGLVLKRFENWRAKLRHEDRRHPRKVLYRRNRGESPRTGPGTNEVGVASAVTSADGASLPIELRRNFDDADKQRIVQEACRPGASISSVARKHGLASSQLFRWRKQLASTMQRLILPVVVSDGDAAPDASTQAQPVAAPLIVERVMPSIEVELVGGRWLRFGRDVDPETIHRLVCLLEGSAA